MEPPCLSLIFLSHSGNGYDRLVSLNRFFHRHSVVSYIKHCLIPLKRSASTSSLQVKYDEVRNREEELNSSQTKYDVCLRHHFRQ